jgi:hypothetical protein
MNNRKKVYRIAKGSFTGVGPYEYLNHKLYKQEGLSESDVKSLGDLLLKKERWTSHPRSKEVIEKINKIGAFQELGCFSTFKTQRPGIWDDPVLKHNIRKKYKNRLDLNEKERGKYRSAFDSEHQMKKWFDDPEELNLLSKLGFSIYTKKIPTEKVFFGQKQVLVIIE